MLPCLTTITNNRQSKTQVIDNTVHLLNGPPGYARTYSVVPYKATGLNPSGKYGPTGLQITKRRAESGGEIPTVFWVPTKNGSNIVGHANEYHANTAKDTKDRT